MKFTFKSVDFLSKEDCPPKRGWTSANQGQAYTEQKADLLSKREFSSRLLSGLRSNISTSWFYSRMPLNSNPDFF